MNNLDTFIKKQSVKDFKIIGNHLILKGSIHLRDVESSKLFESLKIKISCDNILLTSNVNNLYQCNNVHMYLKESFYSDFTFNAKHLIVHPDVDGLELTSNIKSSNVSISKFLFNGSIKTVNVSTPKETLGLDSMIFKNTTLVGFRIRFVHRIDVLPSYTLKIFSAGVCDMRLCIITGCIDFLDCMTVCLSCDDTNLVKATFNFTLVRNLVITSNSSGVMNLSNLLNNTKGIYNLKTMVLKCENDARIVTDGLGDLLFNTEFLEVGGVVYQKFNDLPVNLHPLYKIVNLV